MKHITKLQMDKINDIAALEASMVKGTRMATKYRNRKMIELINQFSTEVGTLPKRVDVVYIMTDNLGTKSYPDTYNMVRTTELYGDLTYRYTDKSIIIETKYNKQVISLDKVLAYVY